MAPQDQQVVRATKAWLQTTWHVQVPFAWLTACVEWLQQEGGAGGHLSQQHINQQVLDQWLLTDLRDLGHPLLPDGVSQAHKAELNGTFCVQVDSVLDISQPAYGQMQKWRGTDCANEKVSAVTQFTQKPWEARPTRVLLLQVTDGVQCLEAMEYQPIPALSTSLRPGVKLQLQGQMVCRLGVLLLRQANVTVLGGEVEDMVHRNSQGKVLCRSLGLPEESQPTAEADQFQEGEQVQPEQDNQDFEELDDEDLLASLEAQEELERAQGGPSVDSGYGTLSSASLSSYASNAHNASIRSELSLPSPPARDSSVQINRNDVVQGHHSGSEMVDSNLVSPFPPTRLEGAAYNMADDFSDEDFDDLPLDELDSVVFQGSATDTPLQSDRDQKRISQHDTTVTGRQQTRASSEPQLAIGDTNLNGRYRGTDGQTSTRAARGMLTPTTSNPPLPSTSAQAGVHSITDDTEAFSDDDMDFDLANITETGSPQYRTLEANQTSRARLYAQEKGAELQLVREGACKVSPEVQPAQSSTAALRREPERESTAVMLNAPPFTYLCLVKGRVSQPQAQATEIRVKAFIVTLLSKLSSSNGAWRISATISDGTGYLDVALSDQVLTRLLGFSAAQKGAMKREPARRAEQDAGMRRCQEGLVDMCCLMTVRIHGTEAVVTRTEPVREKDLQQLEQRVRDRR